MTAPLPKSFRTTRRFLGPPWLTTEGESGLIGYALDVVKDAFLQRLLLGLLARFPETAPSDALGPMGRDRRVVRGLNETSETYVLRLLRWLDDRKTQGNPFALLKKLAEYTGSNSGCWFRTVDARGNWFTRHADGSFDVFLNRRNWNWNASDLATQWSRFWVIIYPGTLWLPRQHNWGDVTGPKWGDTTGTWGSTATVSELDTLRGIVADWKPAGTKCLNIILAFDPASFSPVSPEPDGLWAHWSKNVGGVQVPARLATARYLDGVI